MLLPSDITRLEIYKDCCYIFPSLRILLKKWSRENYIKPCCSFWHIQSFRWKYTRPSKVLGPYPIFAMKLRSYVKNRFMWRKKHLVSRTEISAQQTLKRHGARAWNVLYKAFAEKFSARWILPVRLAQSSWKCPSPSALQKNNKLAVFHNWAQV